MNLVLSRKQMLIMVAVILALLVTAFFVIHSVNPGLMQHSLGVAPDIMNPHH